jgi:hypothetical protein
MSKVAKEFRLYVRPNVVLYDSDLQEVRYSEIIDDGTVVYKLKPIWNKKLEVFVSRPYYAVEYREEPFVRYVEKVVCVGDKPFDVKGSFKCRGGRVMAKLVMWVLDKRFRELCELL